MQMSGIFVDFYPLRLDFVACLDAFESYFNFGAPNNIRTLLANFNSKFVQLTKVNIAIYKPLPITVAARFKAWTVFARSTAII
jgi:hypothetical protein